MSLKYDAKEVLFHLNYMGYRNITKDQLKAFMTDLKKLIIYETGHKKPSELQTETGPCSRNVQRLFDSQTIASKTTQADNPKENQTDPHLKQPLRQRPQPKAKEDVDPKVKEMAASRPSRVCSAKSVTSRRPSSVNFTDKPETLAGTGGETIAKKKPEQKDKENVDPPIGRTSRRPSTVNVAGKPEAIATTKAIAKKKPNQQEKDKENVPAKTKMWIRPRSASQAGRSQNRKTDPVSLYQAYQKDWEKFRSNICESSHSELRWAIREKMLSTR